MAPVLKLLSVPLMGKRDSDARASRDVGLVLTVFVLALVGKTEVVKVCAHDRGSLRNTCRLKLPLPC